MRDAEFPNDTNLMKYVKLAVFDLISSQKIIQNFQSNEHISK